MVENPGNGDTGIRDDQHGHSAPHPAPAPSEDELLTLEPLTSLNFPPKTSNTPGPASNTLGGEQDSSLVVVKNERDVEQIDNIGENTNQEKPKDVTKVVRFESSPIDTAKEIGQPLKDKSAAASPEAFKPDTDAECSKQDAIMEKKDTARSEENAEHSLDDDTKLKMVAATSEQGAAHSKQDELISKNVVNDSTKDECPPPSLGAVKSENGSYLDQIEASFQARLQSSDYSSKATADIGNGPVEILEVATPSPRVVHGSYNAGGLLGDVGLEQTVSEQVPQDSPKTPIPPAEQNDNDVTKQAVSNVERDAQESTEDDEGIDSLAELRAKLRDYVVPQRTAKTDAERKTRKERREKLREKYHAENPTASTTDASTVTSASAATTSEAASGSSSAVKRTTELKFKGPPPKRQRIVLSDEHYTPGTIVWVKIDGFPHWPAMITVPEAYFFLKNCDLEKSVDEGSVVVHFLNDGCLAEVSKTDCFPFKEWKHLPEYDQQQRELNQGNAKEVKRRTKKKKKDGNDGDQKAVELAYQYAVCIYKDYGNNYPQKLKRFEEEEIDSSTRHEKRKLLKKSGGATSKAVAKQGKNDGYEDELATLRAEMEAMRAKLDAKDAELNAKNTELEATRTKLSKVQDAVA